MPSAEAFGERVGGRVSRPADLRIDAQDVAQHLSRLVTEPMPVGSAPAAGAAASRASGRVAERESGSAASAEGSKRVGLSESAKAEFPPWGLFSLTAKLAGVDQVTLGASPPALLLLAAAPAAGADPDWHRSVTRRLRC